MVFDDLLATRQPDTAAFHLGAVQALEDAENAFGLVRRNTDTIVSSRNHPDRTVPSCGDLHFWGAFGRMILDGIGDEVLK